MRRHSQHSDRSTTVCPACAGCDVLPFYEARRLPAHSVLLMETREQATNYPTGDLQLSLCCDCGFVFNQWFDPALNDYNATYEETQHFSPTFSRFAEELCDRLIREYGVRNKTVLEIGCGKGEFLAELCLRGDNRGIGIDPACNPSRLSAETRRRLRFIPELYDESHSRLKADVIICRHTLEHIAPVAAFLQRLRRSLADRRETLVFFEVPALEIILDRIRFWDIYYEHCSYFSEMTLRRLFKRCGFDVLVTESTYSNQYLLLFANPGRRPVASDDGETVFDLERRVATFRREVTGQQRIWREELLANDNVALWGAGSKCVALLTTLRMEEAPLRIVDINPHKQGRFLPGTGHAVVSPEQLREQPPETILAMNPVYCAEIETRLRTAGVGSIVRPLEFVPRAGSIVGGTSRNVA